MEPLVEKPLQIEKSVLYNDFEVLFLVLVKKLKKIWQKKELGYIKGS